ncbi:Crp/Fnr family transcriptional regulator [Amorphus coralli]|uniref:Crp/Fnr family transcriptional regulator n=1 Tax=Amorphus coralli TaxID=340680 RepID=UPI00036068AD|nr:Crp/Fnr family transcriptional regulator [Amorphus coralli]
MLVGENPMLRKLRALEPFSEEEQRLLTSLYTRTVHLGPRQDVVREGDRARECSLLLSGLACRYAMTADGKRQITAFIVPGDIFDIQSLLLEVMDHSVGTIAPSTVAMIPHETLIQISNDSPRVSRAVWKESLFEAAVFREWIVNLGRRSAYQRIAHVMCEFYARHKLVDLVDGDSVAWPMTQTEIADATGLSVVHVNRSIQALRGEGLIRLAAGVLTIQNWSGLAEAGQFEGRYLQGGFPKSAPPLSGERGTDGIRTGRTG